MKLICKQLRSSLLRYKGFNVALALMAALSSFLFFFVRFSIDGNQRRAVQMAEKIADIATLATYQAGLASNARLAMTFLISFAGVLLFVFYMFCKRYSLGQQSALGVALALGYSRGGMALFFALYSFTLTLTGSLVGLSAGYGASSLLVNRHAAQYGYDWLSRAIASDSLATAFICLCVSTALLSGGFFYRHLGGETANLINRVDNGKTNLLLRSPLMTVIALLPHGLRLPLRISLRKISALFLCFTAVLISTFLLITSYSLYRSAARLQHFAGMGLNWQYNYSFTNYQNGAAGADTEPYLQVALELTVADGGFHRTSALGLSAGHRLFPLYDSQRRPVQPPSETGVVAHMTLEKLYGFKPGDTIRFSINGNALSATIARFCANGDPGSVYFTQDHLCEILNIPPGSYNGLLTNSRSEPVGFSNMITKQQKMREIDDGTVSNKQSAVINQLIGVAVALLLLYMVLLLNFTDSQDDRKTLTMLGYSNRESNRLLIDVYRPILTLFYLISLAPALCLSRTMHRSISVQTGDYIPFSWNGAVLGGIYIVIMVLYSVLQLFFPNRRLTYK